MTFLAPAFFYASLVVAGATVALHFIVTRQPRAGILPTARFVPDMPATATARATRPSDLLLLLLRVALVLAMGAGLAKPVVQPSRSANARVILADMSRSVADIEGLRDSLRSIHREGDVVFAFDSSARGNTGSLDSLLNISPSRAEGNVSAALVAAMRAASSLRERADSIELVMVSPLATEEIDAATDSIRALWPGRARVIVAGRSSAVPAPSREERITLRAADDDPLAVTVSRIRAASPTTIIRGASVESDSGIVVHWPLASRPARSIARPARDTIGGVVASEALVVSAFERSWIFPRDSVQGAEVIARWIDGEPAAIEWSSGTGCVRSVLVPVTGAGDLVIRDDFRSLAAALSSECSGQRPSVAADAASIAMLRGSGQLAARDSFRPRGDTRSWLAPWLLGAAMLLAIAELFVRRRKAPAIAAARSSESRMDSAA